MLDADDTTLWTYDSGEFERLMDRCIELSDAKGFAARKKASEKKGKLRPNEIEGTATRLD